MKIENLLYWIIGPIFVCWMIYVLVNIIRILLAMNFVDWTADEIKRALWLRAIEWNGFPAYVSQPLVPILFIFFPWYWIIATVFILAILWSSIRHLYVNWTAAKIACVVVVWTKLPFTILSAVYLFLHHQYVPALIASFWPLLSGLVNVPGGKIGIIELAFAKKIGLVHE